MSAGGHATIKVGRIDVDDVKVTDETGKTVYLPGRYRVYRGSPVNGTRVQVSRQSDRGCVSSYTFPTKTGLYVPDGKYTVVTEFDTAEGLKEHVQKITIP